MVDPERITKQISVFLENKSGRLLEVCEGLGAAEINIRALCVADTSDFGILRLIVADPDGALQVLLARGFSVGETQVFAVSVPDRPGGLASVLAHLERAGLNVEYMYAFFTRISGEAVVVFRVADEMLDRAFDTLAAAGITIMPAQDVYSV